MKLPSKHVLDELKKLPATKQNAIIQVAATMSIEDMELDDDRWMLLIRQANGSLKPEDVIKEAERRIGHHG